MPPFERLTFTTRESLEGAALAGSLGAAGVSIRSAEHGPRAHESSTRSVAPCREQDRDRSRGERIHGVRSPRRASAPPRSSTASALSRAPDLPSRSCPLRAAEDPRFARAAAPAVPGSRPVPRASANRSGWLAGAPPVGARSRSRGSTRPPMRTIRRTRAPVRTHDTAQIDLPRVQLLDGGAGRAWRSRRMLPRGERALNAFTTKARGIKTRAFTFSIWTIYLVDAAADGDDVAGSVQRVFVRIRRSRGIVDTWPCSPQRGESSVRTKP